MSRRKSSIAEVERANDGILRIDDETFRRLSQADPDFLRDQAGAKRAEAFEKDLSVRQSLRLYRRAVIFSMFMSLAVVMEGSSLLELRMPLSYSDTSLYQVMISRPWALSWATMPFVRLLAPSWILTATREFRPRGKQLSRMACKLG
jgi:hypothetical protein